mmetsp:Transcript_20525/g.66638  ORF Transcript_20525/g.66638 Transcript_20525/m.66638 type:complete len:374 (+) Transcript_20525:605-1726(+)
MSSVEAEVARAVRLFALGDARGGKEALPHGRSGALGDGVAGAKLFGLRARNLARDVVAPVPRALLPHRRCCHQRRSLSRTRTRRRHRCGRFRFLFRLFLELCVELRLERLEHRLALGALGVEEDALLVRERLARGEELRHRGRRLLERLFAHHQPRRLERHEPRAPVEERPRQRAAKRGTLQQKVPRVRALCAASPARRRRPLTLRVRSQLHRHQILHPRYVLHLVRHRDAFDELRLEAVEHRLAVVEVPDEVDGHAVRARRERLLREVAEGGSPAALLLRVELVRLFRLVHVEVARPALRPRRAAIPAPAAHARRHLHRAARSEPSLAQGARRRKPPSRAHQPHALHREVAARRRKAAGRRHRREQTPHALI